VAVVGQKADNKVLYKEEKTSGFLEDSILAANNKFFKGNLGELYRLDSNDLILYNTIITYFKGNS
jgi:hypothetical protein